MKVIGWEHRFNHLLATLDGLPFVWGKTDCAMIGARFFDAMCGTDFYDRYKGAYSSRTQALRFARDNFEFDDFLIDHGAVSVGCDVVIQPSDFLFVERDGFSHCVVCAANDIALTSSKKVGRVFATYVSGVLGTNTIKQVIRVN